MGTVLTQQLLAGIFSIVCLASFSERKINRWVYISFLICMVLICTFRPENMADYQQYLSAFRYGADRFEPIFQLAYKGLNVCGFEPLSFFFVVAILTVAIKGGAVWRMTAFPMLSLAVWISDILIIQDMIAVRAALASAFLLWMVYFKCNHHSTYMWVACALAVCSHFSALIIAVLAFISTKKSCKKRYLTALLVSMLFPLANISMLDYMPYISASYEQLLEAYTDSMSANPYNLMVLARCMIAVVLWVYIDRIAPHNKYLILLTKAYTIGCILFFLFWRQISVAFRFGELFWVCEIITFPYLLYIYGKKYKELGKFIPIAISLVLLCLNFTSVMYWNRIDHL